MLSPFFSWFSLVCVLSFSQCVRFFGQINRMPKGIFDSLYFRFVIVFAEYGGLKFVIAWHKVNIFRGGKLGAGKHEIVPKILMDQNKTVCPVIRSFAEASVDEHVLIFRIIGTPCQYRNKFLVKINFNRFIFPKNQRTPRAEKGAVQVFGGRGRLGARSIVCAGRINKKEAKNKEKKANAFSLISLSHVLPPPLLVSFAVVIDCPSLLCFLGNAGEYNQE